ncbi:MAG: hypothetical protein CSA42_07845 [Gammaproteobacteria bacterium]|nr:MAG: hypothetical protein CSA42_07845 [Gammaproteobacteria bacterium]
MNKFQNIPVDKDTKILHSQEVTLGEYQVLYEKWCWDGITAESIIFLAKDVFYLNDADIKKEVRKLAIVNADSDVTLKRSESGYVFVNFNFAID